MSRSNHPLVDRGASMIWQYWGKAARAFPPPGREYPGWHPLAYHCLDVAAVGAAWWEADTSIRRALQAAMDMEEDQARAWVLFFLALHDLGKFDVRFQMKAPEISRLIWTALDPGRVDHSPAVIDRYDHGEGGCLWVALECQDWTGDADGRRLRRWMPWLKAVTGHHGEYPVCNAQPGAFAAEGVKAHDRQARSEWISAAAGLFLDSAGLDLQSVPPECTDTGMALVAGFCSVCDWIGSNTQGLPYATLDPDLSLRDYLDRRIEAIRAGRWLERFGLVNVPLDYGGLRWLLNAGESTRGVQVLVDDLPLASGLTLVEAPTGSGKTEAALAYAWRLLAAGLADAIVFALPTQATANAMLPRAEAFSSHVWPEGANVVLAHGKRRLSEAFERLVRTARTRTVQGRAEAGAQCAEWLASSRKRVFLGQIGVGTVDQVLLSVLPVRHKFVRGFGLARAVLIVDEVHAYDSYMHGLLGEVLRRQKVAGGSAVLLSATLPLGVRDKLLSAWGASGPVEADYPAIWWTDGRGDGSEVEPVSVPESERPERRPVAIECLPLPDAAPDETLLQRIVAAATAGARVAVVCNLVDVAQRLARQLREIAPCPVDIFHARYRFADRDIRENTVVKEQYGRYSARTGGRILVATQVVEQSLDLDFDWMLTQICPVDLLFQRLGRLHRHRRPEGERPVEFRQPRCTVLTVEGDDYGLHKLIYGNTRVLWRTQQMLESAQHIEFPGAYRAWIERVYQDEDWPEEPEHVANDYRNYLGRQMASAQEASSMVHTPRRQFGDDDETILIKTRDGEMSLSILALRDDGRLLDGTEMHDEPTQAHLVSLELNTIPVPDSWKDSLRGCERDEDGRYLLRLMRQEPEVWVAIAGRNRFIYSADFGLERPDTRQPKVGEGQEAVR
jgi:CRISPR-associated endonuclease/helicase Cas3